VGFVGNLRYLEMLDFMLGFAAIDIAGDDGYTYSRWPWQRGAILTDFDPDPDEPYTVCAKCKGYRDMPQGVDGPGGWSPFDKMKPAGDEDDKKKPEPKKPPRMCRCPKPRPAPVKKAEVSARPAAPVATSSVTEPKTKATGTAHDRDEAERLSQLRP